MTIDTQRVIDLEYGVAMVVTDLHGDWALYRRYRDRFLELHAQGQADHLIFTGDLLHRTPPAPDKSLAIILDVLALEAKLGNSLIYLMGNHELPHVYSFTLQRDDDLFTPRFEQAMGKRRGEIVTLLKRLPLYVRTKAGVTLCHAGASPIFANPEATQLLLTVDHDAVWEATAVTLSPATRNRIRRLIEKQEQLPYAEIVARDLAITDPDDPRYDDYIIGLVTLEQHPALRSLWSALFTRNEYQYKSQYPAILRMMLATLSTGFYPQNWLVSGHIDVKGGATAVGNQQLRLASGKHALPLESARYLLFDTEQPIHTLDELESNIKTLFSS